MRHIILTVGGIFAGGLILDILGSGALGSVPKKLAKQITNGYGV